MRKLLVKIPKNTRMSSMNKQTQFDDINPNFVLGSRHWMHKMQP